VPSGADVPVVSGDPFVGGQGPLLSLTAVPVTMVFPTSAEQAASPTASVSPTPDATSDQWVSYTDTMGFSLEMPASWGKTSVTDELVLSAPGGEPYIQITRVPNEGFHDDSSFPLDYSTMASSSQPHFYGDGQAFIIQWLTGSAASPTDADVSIFDRLTRSIAFEPWRPGDSRNGWTQAWDGVTKLPKTSPAWVSANDAFWIVTQSGDARLAYGPVEFCNGASTSVDEQAGTATIACANGANGTWDAQGNPAVGNWQGWSKKLDQHPAVVSWDGYLLLRLP
jgi:hypothetical protein